MNRRKFLFSLAALSALPALRLLPSPKEPETILNWLDSLPLEDNSYFSVLAGTETVDWFRTNQPGKPCRFQYDHYPWRYDDSHNIVSPYATRAAGIGRMSVNKRWMDAPFEQLWAYAGSTIYSAIFDRESKRVVFFPDMNVC